MLQLLSSVFLSYLLDQRDAYARLQEDYQFVYDTISRRVGKIKASQSQSGAAMSSSSYSSSGIIASISTPNHPTAIGSSALPANLLAEAYAASEHKSGNDFGTTSPVNTVQTHVNIINNDYASAPTAATSSSSAAPLEESDDGDVVTLLRLLESKRRQQVLYCTVYRIT
jgi:hypothetical protein